MLINFQISKPWWYPWWWGGGTYGDLWVGGTYGWVIPTGWCKFTIKKRLLILPTFYVQHFTSFTYGHFLVLTHTIGIYGKILSS